MGGNGADLGRRQHLKIRNKMTTEPTRPETAMTIMRVVLSLKTAIPCAEFVDYHPGVRGRKVRADGRVWHDVVERSGDRDGTRCDLRSRREAKEREVV